MKDVLPVLSFGQVCDVNKLEQCNSDEVCSSTGSSGVCQCAPGFSPASTGQHCQQQLPDAVGHTTAAWAAAILITLAVVVVAVVILGALHQRLNLLVPLGALCPTCGALCGNAMDRVVACWDGLPRLHPFGVRSGRARMMDDFSGVDEDPVV